MCGAPPKSEIESPFFLENQMEVKIENFETLVNRELLKESCGCKRDYTEDLVNYEYFFTNQILSILILSTIIFFRKLNRANNEFIKDKIAELKENIRQTQQK